MRRIITRVRRSSTDGPGHDQVDVRARARSGGHAHSHSQGHLPSRAVATSPLVRFLTLGLLALVASATAWGLVALWPDGSEVARVAERATYVVEGTTFERGEVLSVGECESRPTGAEDPSGSTGSAEDPSPGAGAAGSATGSCRLAGVGLLTGADQGRFIRVEMRGPLAEAGIRPGDRVELAAYPIAPPPDPGLGQGDASGPGDAAEQGGAAEQGDSAEQSGAAEQSAAAEPGADAASDSSGPAARYEIARGYDVTGVFRGWPLVLLTLVFAAVVIAVGRLRGLLALAALAIAAAVLLLFVLPALVAGEPGLLVGVVGSCAIMFAILYLVHGPNLRTTAALVGTLCGILIMAAISLVAVHATRLSGMGDEAAGRLSGVATGIDFRGLLACAIIIAGLGVLNDVTITQASSVWELRAAAPAMPRREIYARAMRIGRDHIASTVYTVFFAYVGAALSVLILLYLYNRPVLSLLTHEDIVVEIVRTLCGSVGLVLAVPITTGVAVLFVPASEERGSEMRDPEPLGLTRA